MFVTITNDVAKHRDVLLLRYFESRYTVVGHVSFLLTTTIGGLGSAKRRSNGFFMLGTNVLMVSTSDFHSMPTSSSRYSVLIRRCKLLVVQYTERKCIVKDKLTLAEGVYPYLPMAQLSHDQFLEGVLF